MKTYILPAILFSSVIFFGSCGNSNQQVPEPTEPPTATVAEDEFNGFWKSFRNAVLENNFEEIKKSTLFPLKAKGEMDDAPVISYNKNEFDEIFKMFLDTPTGLNPYDFTETNKDYIENNETIAFNKHKVPMILDSRVAYVASMEFEKQDKEWKLALIYFDKSDYILSHTQP